MFIPFGDDNIKGGAYPLFSYAFLGINVLVYLFQVSLSPEAYEGFVFTFGSTPAETMRGQNLYTLVTSMFVHGSFLHLLGNMIFLWIFADNIEATIGNLRFVLFYLAGGLAAQALHIYFNPASEIPTVGASGAISAVMGAYLIMFPRSQIKMLFFIFPFRLSAWIFLVIWIWQQWAAGSATLKMTDLEGVGVAYWAHIGGFIFGMVMGIYYRNRGQNEYQISNDEY